MKKVNIESPYSGATFDDMLMNLRYARLCMRDSIIRGEAPIASHLLYTQPGILDDTDPTERALGMNIGFDWNKNAQVTVVYTDLGISAGMQLGIQDAEKNSRPVEYRQLEKGWQLI